MAEEPLTGYKIPDPHGAAFAVYTSGLSGTPKGVLREFGNIKLDELTSKTARKQAQETGAFISPLNFL